MYLPRSLLKTLEVTRELPPAGPLQERLAGSGTRREGSLIEAFGSVRRIRWRAISRLRRADEAARLGGGCSWNS